GPNGVRARGGAEAGQLRSLDLARARTGALRRAGPGIRDLRANSPDPLRRRRRRSVPRLRRRGAPGRERRRPRAPGQRRLAPPGAASRLPERAHAASSSQPGIVRGARPAPSRVAPSPALTDAAPDDVTRRGDTRARVLPGTDVSVRARAGRGSNDF